MHPALKKGTKISITLAILVGFFVIALFHEIIIPTVNMKVQVYSNFNKKNSEKIKSPSSRRNGRFNTPKCRGNLQPAPPPLEAQALCTCKGL
jgi:hypothetical protein